MSYIGISKIEINQLRVHVQTSSYSHRVHGEFPKIMKMKNMPEVAGKSISMNLAHSCFENVDVCHYNSLVLRLIAQWLLRKY